MRIILINPPNDRKKGIYMKKTLMKLLALFGAVLLAASMTACDNGSSDDGDSGSSSYTATGGDSGGGETGGTSSKTVTTVFVKMDAGTFSMGCSAGSSYTTVHSVTLTRDFWICDHEVTQAEYKAVMGTNPSSHLGDESRARGICELERCNRILQQAEPEGREDSLLLGKRLFRHLQL